MKNLMFDANSLRTTTNGHHLSLDIDTDYPGEVLNNFTPEEIISHFGYDTLLDTIGEMEVKDHFGIEDCE